ncbi:hypothetical protein B0H17DRAFT_68328 [Mycena rosella]|uniref:DUF6534 domain-containing protein n=1 Tax=Mycena rosella TaxID=1033263 RepID=A0AAD7G9R3_MYCRO|nr:hypothetical protein B0H17DRAFT_68328 [Mycena rosella]
MATVHNTLGLMYDAVVISAVLYGAGILQYWIYYQKYSRKDPLMNRVLVALVLIVNTCQLGLLTASCKFSGGKSELCLITYTVYEYLVTGHLDPLAFSRNVKTLTISIYPSATIVLMGRNFSAYRIYRLSNGNYILAGSITLPSLVIYGCILFSAATFMGYQDIAQFQNIKSLSLAIAVLGAVVDTLISVIIIHLLIYYKGDNTDRKTTDLLNYLIIFTFSAGLPVTLASVASAISLAVAPNTLVYIFWFSLLPNLYTNSLMVTLNSRAYIRSRGSDESIQMQSSLRFRSRPEIISSPRSGPDDSPIAIRIRKPTENELDLDHYSTEDSESREI